MTTVVSNSLSEIVESFSKDARPQMPKVARLYNAIVDVIADGRLAVGAKLPGERELSDACGISLGTAQKSLALLSRDGQIIREHGRGSFVQNNRRPLHELWHYRFKSPQATELLPVYARVIARFHSNDTGPWENEIGTDPNGYIHIRRLIDVDGRFVCWSTMTFSATRFGALLDLSSTEIECVNIKSLLHERFDAPTLAVRQTANVAPAPAEAMRDAGWTALQICLALNITALGRQMTPLSYQTIIVPPTDYQMEIGPNPGDLKG